MTATATSATKRWNWRTIAYVILAGLFGLQALVIGAFVLAPFPWRGPLDPNVTWITKWHAAQSAMGAGVFVGLLLLATLWHPQKRPALIQLFVLEMIAAVIIALLRIPVLGFFPSDWVQFVIVAVIIALYPAARELFSLKGEGAASKPLLTLTIIAGVLLLPDLWRNLNWQITGFGGDPARRFFWLETVFDVVTLFVGGLLTAIKRPGWQVLGGLLGIAYLYFGVVALTLPDEIGSWGTVGGILSIIGGVGYLALTLWEAKVVASKKQGAG